MYITWDVIIAAGGALSAVSAFVVLFWKLFRWIHHQQEQDEHLCTLEARVQKELADIREKHRADKETVQTEQSLIVYGLLACLRGLQEKGCNGPVSEAAEKLEKHLNLTSHKV